MSADGRFAIVAGRRVLVGQLNAPSSSDRRLDLPAAGRCAAFAPDGALLVGLERSYLVNPPAGGDVEEGPTRGESSLITSLSAGSNLVAVAEAGLRIIWLFDRSSALKAHVQAPDGGGFVVPSPHFDVAVAGMGRCGSPARGNFALSNGTPAAGCFGAGAGRARGSSRSAAAAIRRTSRCCPAADS